VLPGPNNASAVWAAQRVPDDHVAVVANGLTIRQMDLEDKDNFLASENVIQAAVDAGFFDPNAGKPFDFTAAYVCAIAGSWTWHFIVKAAWLEDLGENLMYARSLILGRGTL
jgi:hypothetical protein